MRLALLALALFAGTTLAADDGWRSAGTRDGIAIAVRDVEGSAVHELRATTHAAAAPATILATLWRYEEYPAFVPYVARLDVLEERGDTRLVYEQLHLPLVKDRDIVLRVTRHADPASGACELVSEAVAGEGPPPSDRFVRVRTSKARWQLAPAADGGADVTYTIRTDGGGLVPGWIVNAAQREAAPKLVRAIVERAARTR